MTPLVFSAGTYSNWI